MTTQKLKPRMECIRFGFWRGKRKSTENLPWPKAGILSREKRDEIKRLFADAEYAIEWLNWGNKEHYKGASLCRVCGVINGASEYVLINKGVKYIWPWGASHYVDHGVEVPKDFLRMLKAISYNARLAPLPNKVTK